MARPMTPEEIAQYDQYEEDQRAAEAIGVRITEGARKFIGGLSGNAGALAHLGGVGNSLGASSQYQKAIERPMQQDKHHWADQFAQEGAKVGQTLRIRFPNGALTRFDPSTKTRVSVTQEWVDEAVAEIVRLNIEMETKGALPVPVALMERIAGLVDLEPDTTEQDRIWEAVRAASAV